jgi:hypothetical protein
MKTIEMTRILLAAGLGLGLGCGVALGQSAGQDMKDAGHDTKAATVDTGHATKTTTKRVYHKTKHVTKKAYHKTAEGTKTAAIERKTQATRWRASLKGTRNYAAVAVAGWGAAAGEAAIAATGQIVSAASSTSATQ